MCTFSYICSATCTCPPAVLNVVRCCCPARRHMALACARPPCTTTLNVGGRSRPCVCRASILEYSKVKEFMWIWPNTLNHNGWSFDQTMSVHQKSNVYGLVPGPRSVLSVWVMLFWADIHSVLNPKMEQEHQTDRPVPITLFIYHSSIDT